MGTQPPPFLPGHPPTQLPALLPRTTPLCALVALDAEVLVGRDVDRALAGGVADTILLAAADGGRAGRPGVLPDLNDGCGGVGRQPVSGSSSTGGKKALEKTKKKPGPNRIAHTKQNKTAKKRGSRLDGREKINPVGVGWIPPRGGNVTYQQRHPAQRQGRRRQWRGLRTA